MENMNKYIVDDLDVLIEALPLHIQTELRERDNLGDLLEVVLDLGRLSEARFLETETVLASMEITMHCEPNICAASCTSSGFFVAAVLMATLSAPR